MNNRTSERPIADVLLVEDNPEDVVLMQHLLDETGARLNLHVVMDGVEALAFLRREDAHREAPRPDLIILDLNLPKKSGHEVLREIKADDDLRPIPVVVLTTSKAEEDVLQTYDLQATSFISKAIDLDEYVEALQTIMYYWLSVVVLPPKTRAPW